MKQILVQDTNGNLKKEARDFCASLNAQLRDRNEADKAQVVSVSEIIDDSPIALVHTFVPSISSTDGEGEFRITWWGVSIIRITKWFYL